MLCLVPLDLCYLPQVFSGLNCIYPSDFLPFTRRPLLLIIDSESSEAFKASITSIFYYTYHFKIMTYTGVEMIDLLKNSVNENIAHKEIHKITFADI